MNGNSGSRGERQRRHETRSEDSAGEGGGSQSIDPSRRRRQPGSTSPGFVDVGVYTLRVSVYPDISAREDATRERQRETQSRCCIGDTRAESFPRFNSVEAYYVGMFRNFSNMDAIQSSGFTTCLTYITATRYGVYMILF